MMLRREKTRVQQGGGGADQKHTAGHGIEKSTSVTLERILLIRSHLLSLFLLSMFSEPAYPAA